MKIRVWDLPTRLFHWALVICLIGSVVSVYLGGNAVEWHFRFGYGALALVVFRIVWGFAGSRYARFSSFPPDPRAVLRYLRGQHVAGPGHNPLGAFSVYALLASLLFQASTGLFANDSIMWDGPLRNLVSNDTSDLLTRLHKLNRWLLLVLIATHLGAITYYTRVRKERLIGPMVSGDKEVIGSAGAKVTEAGDGAAVRARALLILAAVAAAVWALVTKVAAPV